MTVQVSHTVHAVFVRLSPGDALIDALVARLRDGAVATGALRGHGVLEHVELRTYSPTTRTLGPARAIAGAVHALMVEGTIGLSEGAPHLVLRAVLSREMDAGVETLSGIVVGARVVAFEAVVTSAQDLALPLAHDARAGLMMIGAPSGGAPAAAPLPMQPMREESPRPPAASGAWADVVATSAAQGALKGAAPAAMPARPPPKPVTHDEGELLLPEAGDEVQHFAFGKCEVLKSDGDRLHLRVGKDARIREIALEMLKVTQLDDDPNVRPRHFKLDRKL